MEREYKFKVVMLGDFAVGKTSLVRRFVYNIFSDKYLTTLGVKVMKILGRILLLSVFLFSCTSWAGSEINNSNYTSRFLRDMSSYVDPDVIYNPAGLAFEDRNSITAGVQTIFKSFYFSLQNLFKCNLKCICPYSCQFIVWIVNININININIYIYQNFCYT